MGNRSYGQSTAPLTEELEDTQSDVDILLHLIRNELDITDRLVQSSLKEQTIADYQSMFNHGKKMYSGLPEVYRVCEFGKPYFKKAGIGGDKTYNSKPDDNNDNIAIPVFHKKINTSTSNNIFPLVELKLMNTYIDGGTHKRTDNINKDTQYYKDVKKFYEYAGMNLDDLLKSIRDATGDDADHATGIYASSFNSGLEHINNYLFDYFKYLKDEGKIFTEESLHQIKLQKWNEARAVADAREQELLQIELDKWELEKKEIDDKYNEEYQRWLSLPRYREDEDEEGNPITVPISVPPAPTRDPYPEEPKAEPIDIPNIVHFEVFRDNEYPNSDMGNPDIFIGHDYEYGWAKSFELGKQRIRRNFKNEFHFFNLDNNFNEGKSFSRYCITFLDVIEENAPYQEETTVEFVHGMYKNYDRYTDNWFEKNYTYNGALFHPVSGIPEQNSPSRVSSFNINNIKPNLSSVRTEPNLITQEEIFELPKDTFSILGNNYDKNDAEFSIQLTDDDGSKRNGVSGSTFHWENEEPDSEEKVENRTASHIIIHKKNKRIIIDGYCVYHVGRNREGTYVSAKDLIKGDKKGKKLQVIENQHGVFAFIDYDFLDKKYKDNSQLVFYNSQYMTIMQIEKIPDHDFLKFLSGAIAIFALALIAMGFYNLGSTLVEAGLLAMAEQAIVDAVILTVINYGFEQATMLIYNWFGEDIALIFSAVQGAAMALVAFNMGGVGSKQILTPKKIMDSARVGLDTVAKLSKDELLKSIAKTTKELQERQDELDDISEWYKKHGSSMMRLLGLNESSDAFIARTIESLSHMPDLVTGSVYNLVDNTLGKDNPKLYAGEEASNLF